jgi:transcriptional regulator with XRE-family HTH domain
VRGKTQLGVSQEELAARANLHRNYVGSVERGERDIGITALGSLAVALGVSFEEFFAPCAVFVSTVSFLPARHSTAPRWAFDSPRPIRYCSG